MSEQQEFKNDNLSDDQKRWLSHVRRACCSRTTIDLSASITNGTFRYARNAKTSDTGRLMIDGCADTGVAAIGPGNMAEVYTTDRTVTLLGFDEDLFKEKIPIGGAAGSADLPGGTIILQMNEVPLIKGGSTSLLSTTQAREFGVKVNDVAKRHGGQQSIQVGDTIIPLQLQRALLSIPIREPTRWELENLPRVIVTSDEPWDPTKFNDSLEGTTLSFQMRMTSQMMSLTTSTLTSLRLPSSLCLQSNLRPRLLISSSLSLVLVLSLLTESRKPS